MPILFLLFPDGLLESAIDQLKALGSKVKGDSVHPTSQSNKKKKVIIVNYLVLFIFRTVYSGFLAPKCQPASQPGFGTDLLKGELSCIETGGLDVCPLGNFAHQWLFWGVYLDESL